MRRFLFGVVIASVTAAMPTWAFGGDREIAESIMAQLQQAKSQGMLKGFDLDLKVETGVVYLTGNVRSAAQHKLVLDAVEHTQGVAKLVDEVKVNGEVAKQAEPAKSNFSLGNLIKQGPGSVVPASANETTPTSSADDSITDTIIGRLQQQKDAGALRGFDLDVTTTEGQVWLQGKVSSAEQKALIIDTARRVKGVKKVIDDVLVGTEVRQVSTGAAPLPQVPAQEVLQPVPQVSSMPVAGAGVPRAFAPAMAANMGSDAALGGTPVPMQAGTVAYGGGAPRYDQPYMPSYAWPSYAAYPNYAAVTYPKQYSPSAWPYIGPFYPYPQVPLGWRKVALEWDDGLWYLDFTSK